MPNYWRISDRAIRSGQPSSTEQGPLTYWIADTLEADGGGWEKVTQNQFQTLLKAAADDLNPNNDASPEDQPHVNFFIHGFNVSWLSSSQSYLNLCKRLFSSRAFKGLCVSFDWPSYGSVLGYYPDRAHARSCAQDLVTILSGLYEYLLDKQAAAIRDPDKGCKSKLSVIAHSMGNYVFQNAMANVWTRKNQPLLASLVNQLVMVAADVDNDLFDDGARDYNDGGNAIANLCYRVTALYSGRDAVLGMPAGLKHFGARRLGRSGLAHRPPISNQLPATDNVWDVDCSSFFPSTTSGTSIHGAYLETDGTIKLMQEILRGTDRGVLQTRGLTKGDAWP